MPKLSVISGGSGSSSSGDGGGGKRKQPKRESNSALTKEFIAWLGEVGISYNYHTDSWRQKTAAGTQELGWQDVEDYLIAYGPIAYASKLQLTRAAMRLWANEERTLRIRDLNKRIASWRPTESEGKRVWEEWIHAIAEDGHDMSLVVMQHFVWQVRRKLLGGVPTDHMCPIFFGLTKSGKSTELRRFCAPLAEVTAELTLPQLADERHWVELNRHYIIYLDEMAGSRRADQDVLKGLITKETVAAHVFHSQRRAHLRQNSTLLGSSNTPVVDIIHDETSARRYWEVRCLPVLRWGALEALDKRLLWGSIPGDTASPLDAFPDLKSEIQDLQHYHLRRRPAIEVWAEDKGIQKGDIAVDFDRLYESYLSWCGDQRVSAVNKQVMARQLKGMLRLTRKRTAKSRQWMINKKL